MRRLPRLSCRPVGDRRGMTVVELIVSLLIFSVITAVVLSFLSGSRRTYDDTSDRAAYQQSLRAVFGLLTREIRSAGCDPLEAGIGGFTVADVTTLRCRMDLDGDGNATDIEPEEDVTYTYLPADAELQRTTVNSSMTILRDVQAVTFTYFDEGGDPLGPLPLTADLLGRVRFVEIAISGEIGSGEPVTYSTRVHVRNG